ncbi:MAG: DciA family protein [Acetobacteraceae bacterium]
MTDDRDDTRADMANQKRHVYGPRPVGALVPALTRPAFKRSSAAAAQVMVDWEAIVGPQLASVTEPRRMSGGTLTIACSGPVAMELQHMAIEIMNRINTSLGSRTVRALRFVQVSVFPGTPVRPVPPPSAVAAAEAAVGDMPPGPLRDALIALGSVVLAQNGRLTNRVTKR